MSHPKPIGLMTDTHDLSDRCFLIDHRPVLPPLEVDNECVSKRTSFEQYRDDGLGAEHTVSPVHVIAEDNDGTACRCGEPTRHFVEQNQHGDLHASGNETMNPERNTVMSISKSQDVFLPGKDCHARRPYFTSRSTWLNGGIICICSISTTFSAIFVLLASKGQRYGNLIGNNPDSKMEISTAILTTSVVAKTIELTLVTASVAFMGQVISRKALKSTQGSGVTLAEITMWRWVVQPGTLLTQSEIARYSGLTILGVLTILTAVLSTFYVTAATAVVQPVSKESQWHSKIMAGSVKADFANALYQQSLCQTPVNRSIDPVYSGVTCTQSQYAGRSLHNHEGFMAAWVEYASTGNGSSNQQQRPAKINLPYLGSEVVPQWVNIINTTETSHRYGRVFNRVSLALPHVGVVNAVHDQRNSLPRSEVSGSPGSFSLWAAVPSPVIDVLCVHMNETELKPIVYSAWPNDDHVDAITWSPSLLLAKATTTNETVVDEIFDWNKKDTKYMLDYPPVFPKFPIPFNTVLNKTGVTPGRSAIYIMGQGADNTSWYRGPELAGIFPVCRIQVGISSECSTRYSVSTTGSRVEALCDDSAKDMAYIEVQANASRYRGVSNWGDIGTYWSYSLGLETGIFNGSSSISRLLMSWLLAPSDVDNVYLNPLLPSLAEALAILASDTVVLSWQGVSFKDYWVSR